MSTGPAPIAINSAVSCSPDTRIFFSHLRWEAIVVSTSNQSVTVIEGKEAKTARTDQGAPYKPQAVVRARKVNEGTECLSRTIPLLLVAFRLSR